MSATRPATEFSIGIMPNLASPEVIAAKQSSKVGQGTASASGYASRMARCEFAPGSPWNTILVVMAAVLPRSPILNGQVPYHCGGRFVQPHQNLKPYWNH